MLQKKEPGSRFYRPRNPESSPFYKIVEKYFDEFERVYPDRYGMRFGFWRPIIHKAIDKFLKCGDLKHGFARVRCPKPDLSLSKEAARSFLSLSPASSVDAALPATRNALYYSATGYATRFLPMSLTGSGYSLFPKGYGYTSVSREVFSAISVDWLTKPCAKSCSLR